VCVACARTQLDLSGGDVTRVEGVAGASLYAVEIKVDEAVEDFKRLVSGLAESGGGGGDGQVGIADFADVFDVVPPGVDELVALSKVVSLARADEYGLHFERVIIDTAPTGHTLRLLTFPDFLDRFIERLLLLRQRFQGVASLVGGVSSLLKNFGGAGGSGVAGAVAEEEPRAVVALQQYQQQMRELQALLHDPAVSEFCIVTIPTALALAESERLLHSLREQGIACRRGVLNRLIAPDANEAYLEQMTKGQQVCLAELEDLAARADVSLTRVPFFDVEVRAVYGLRALGSSLFAPPS